MSATGSRILRTTPIQARSLREVIVDHLERAIMTGMYRPGQRLVERDLTAQFGVSSIPVREALQDLESRGLVTKRLNHGCSVVELTREDVERITELRRVLEPKVVEWAARRITGEQLERLREHLERMSTAAETGNYPEFFHEDLLFHKRIWESSGNRFAARSLESAIGSLFASGMTTSEAAISLPEEVRKHRLLLEALQARDPKAASKALTAIALGFKAHLGGL